MNTPYDTINPARLMVQDTPVVIESITFPDNTIQTTANNSGTHTELVNGSNKVSVATTGTVKLDTGGATRLDVDVAGNVGVPTADSDFKLKVAGGYYLTGKGQNQRCILQGKENENTILELKNGGHHLDVFNNQAGTLPRAMILQFYSTGQGTGITHDGVFMFGKSTVNQLGGVSNYQFYVNGKAGGNGLWVTSDDRIKFNETPITNSLDTLNKVKFYKYDKIIQFPADPSNQQGDWLPTDASWNDLSGSWETNDEYGVVAQEIEQIDELKFLVDGQPYDESGNQTPLHVDYTSIFALNCVATQELDAKIKSLEARLAALE